MAALNFKAINKLCNWTKPYQMLINILRCDDAQECVGIAKSKGNKKIVFNNKV